MNVCFFKNCYQTDDTKICKTNSKTKSEKPRSLDLELKNGLTAKNIGADNNCNPVFSIEYNERGYNAVLLDGVLYSISGDDWDEPISPLKDAFQPLEVQL